MAPTDAPDAALADQGGSGLNRVLRGYGALTASSLVGQVIGFAALAYVARRTGAANLGAYVFASTIATYFGLFAGLGINYLGMRDIAENRDALRSILRQTLAALAILAILLYGVLVAVAPWLTSDPVARQMLPIVGLIIPLGVVKTDWLLVALGRAKQVALWLLVGQLVYGALIPVFVTRGASGTLRYAWLNVLGVAVTASGCAWSTRRAVRDEVSSTTSPFFALTWHAGSRRALLRRLVRSLPFGYSLIMMQVYAAIDLVLLGYLDSTRSVGTYSVANRLPLAIAVLANLWLVVLLPHTAHRLRTERTELMRDLGRAVTAAMIIAAAIGIGAWACGNALIPLMFGSAFRSASGPFALLALAAGLALVRANFSNVLLAAGTERYYAAAVTGGAIVVVVLDVLLIPPYGPIGAAVATFAAEAALLTILIAGVMRRVGSLALDRDRLARGAGAVGIMGLATLAAHSVGGAPAQVGTALVSFTGASLALRVFDRRLLL